MKFKLAAALAASVSLVACAAQTTDEAAEAAETAAEVAEVAAAPFADLVANEARQEMHTARDAARHPGETLAFFGLEPGMTVIEISPGSGYYAEILAKHAKDTGGSYVATGNPIEAIGDTEMYGAPTYVEFGADSGPLVEAGSADMVLTFRNVHNWYWRDGMLDKAMSDFAAALKPGGVLGVVDHRADPRPEVEVGGRPAGDAYMAKASIVAAAEKAGLVLDGESEINANPKDTKDHPFGVWTLPPNLRSAGFRDEPNPDFDHSPYEAIGESDRHTLRFKKPA